MSGRRTETMARDAQMYMLHQQNVPHEKIAEKFGVSLATVGTGVRRAIQDQFRLSAEEERMVVSDQIDGLMRTLRFLMNKKSYKIGINGKVVIDPMTGEPLVDYSEHRQTVLALEKLLAAKRKLLGLDMPVRHRVEITDKMDEEIERIAADLAARGAGTPVPAEPAMMSEGGDERRA